MRQQEEKDVCEGVRYIHPADMEAKVGTKKCLKDLAAVNCKDEGQQGCVVRAPFRAVDNASLDPTKIRSQAKISDVTGTMTAASANPTCTASQQTDCQVTEPMRAYNKAGLVNTIIKSGMTVLGVKGKYVDPNDIAPCSATVTTNCHVTGTYVAVSKEQLTPANIKKGVTIGSVTGDYPSTSHELNVTQPSLPNLSLANFAAAVAGNETYVYFDRNGDQHSLTGVDIKAPQVKENETIFGVKGTAKALVPPDYRKLRQKASLYGGKGLLKLDCRNAFPTGHDMAKSFPSIDDSGPTKATNYKWDATTRCDTELWEDVSKDENGDKMPCTASKTDCVYRNIVTGLLWRKDATKDAIKFTAAKERCQNIAVTDGKNWRLPTHRELLQAYVHRIRYVGDGQQFLDGSGSYWTSSSLVHAHSNFSMDDMGVNLAQGEAKGGTPRNSQDFKVLCVK